MNALSTGRSVLMKVVWVVVAALIALGGAGLVAAMNHVPGTISRVELTWADDAAALPALDAATVKLEQLSTEVGAFGDAARQALAALASSDTTTLNDSITAGSLQEAKVDAADKAFADALAAVPGVGPSGALTLSDDLRHRYEELAANRDLTTGFAADWAGFTSRALDASNLAMLLARHDVETAAAAKEGAAAHYKPALKLLDKPAATIADARKLRDSLASTTDVTTLTTWLDRNAAYDKALRTLYQALSTSKGKVTTAVRKAFDAEQTARDQLPGDTRGLVVIMSDIAQGGLNQAVASIEDARGKLTKAVDLQHQLQAVPALPQ